MLTGRNSHYQAHRPFLEGHVFVSYMASLTLEHNPFRPMRLRSALPVRANKQTCLLNHGRLFAGGHFSLALRLGLLGGARRFPNEE